MSAQSSESNVRPGPDAELVAIADYVTGGSIASAEAYDTARYCLMDSLGCAMLALRYPACVRHLGPIVPGTLVPGGVRVPGTKFELEPIKAAFDIGCTIRWLDYNDTWLAAEWGHPSDNLGAILAVADYVCRRGEPGSAGASPSRAVPSTSLRKVVMREILTAMIQAHEIQGVLALENSFNRVGLDHVVLVKVASTAVATKLLGGNKGQIVDALSHAWIDGQSLRTYRYAPNTGPRKSWAAADATSRAVRLAILALQGEPGLPSALTAPKWGFYDVLFKGNRFKTPHPYGSYVMENVLFKVAFPAEFHAQTAAECAIKLHPVVKDRLGAEPRSAGASPSRIDEIERIVLTTQESAIRIISKTGPLHNPADRDHSLQYVVAIGLLFGSLNADHYEDTTACDPGIDALRAKMQVIEDPRYTREYLEPEKRSIANAVQVFFRDGTATDKVEVEYPLGHRLRRAEGIPLLVKKFQENLATRLPEAKAKAIAEVIEDRARLEAMPVDEFMGMWAN